MFDKHRAKKAEEAYEKAESGWEAERDQYAELLDIARSFTGTNTNEIMLAKGEALFFKVTNVALVEERRGAGHYEGRSSGFSIPVGTVGGRTVRYRVGASRGHFVQGAPVPTAVDTGTVFITNRRVIFEGARQTRECAFAKLIGFQHDDAEGSTTFSVSNRQKPTTIVYGPDLSGAFDFRLDLALAHFRDTVDELVGGMTEELAEIDSQRPAAPVQPPR